MPWTEAILVAYIAAIWLGVWAWSKWEDETEEDRLLLVGIVLLGVLLAYVGTLGMSLLIRGMGWG